jgi:hypothetical protein
MEQQLRRLGRPFKKRSCRLSQNPGVLLMFLKTTAKTPRGRNPKASIQVAPKRNDIVCNALIYPGIGELNKDTSLDPSYRAVRSVSTYGSMHCMTARHFRVREVKNIPSLGCIVGMTRLCCLTRRTGLGYDVGMYKLRASIKLGVPGSFIATVLPML